MAFRSIISFPSTASLPRGPVRDWLGRLRGVIAEAFKRVEGIALARASDCEVDDTGNADTEFAVTHALGRLPVGFVVYYSDAAAGVYDSGGTAWTTQTIYLKCDAANAHLKVWVL